MRLLLPPSRTVANAIGDGAPIDHYTGTLYKALGVPEWSRAERRWAFEHLLIHDAQAGIVSAGSWDAVSLAPEPGVPQTGARTAPSLLIDARSKEYVRRLPAPAGAVGLRVVTVGDDGRRLAISHWNKHHKGVLAAALVRDRPRVRRLDDLVAWGAAVDIRLERMGETEIDLVV